MAALLSVIDVVLDAHPGGVREKNEPRSGIDLMERCVERFRGARTTVGVLEDFLFFFDRGSASADHYAGTRKQGADFVCCVTDQEAARLPGTSVEELRARVSGHPERPARRAGIGQTRGSGGRIPGDRFAHFPPDGSLCVIPALRIVWVEIPGGKFENLAATLSPACTLADLRLLHTLRWPLESAICRLKPMADMLSLHARKLENVGKMLWGRLILYNACMLIAALGALWTEFQKACASLRRETRTVRGPAQGSRKAGREYVASRSASIRQAPLPYGGAQEAGV